MTIECPKCGKDDEPVSVFELVSNTQDEELAKKLGPPPEPVSPMQPISMMNEGLGCLGALFFGAAFFLSITYASVLAAVIFGFFTLLFTAAFILTIIRMLRARNSLKEIIPVWEQKMGRWQKLYYCASDEIVFDPESGKYAPVDEMNTLLQE
ncbi:MAG: hypothetical protein MUO76_20420 [Anaerolineaceae bacterium]|nr:hypothetical protein [Anaerolineaceae bacterium]